MANPLLVSMQGTGPAPSGSLAVEEALSLLQAVAGGNSSTVGLVLLPFNHSSTSWTSILKNRRILEDKCSAMPGKWICFKLLLSLRDVGRFAHIRTFEVNEISINFEASTHAGDRRRTSQQ